MPTGACGINCDVCRLNLMGVCSTCGPGKSQEAQIKIGAQERILGHPCPILACAFDRHVDYCPRDCDRFPCNDFKIGAYPYSQGYLNMQERRRRERAQAKIPCGDLVKTPTQYWEDLEQRDVTILCKHALADVYPPSNLLLPFLGRELLVDRKERRLLCLKHDRSVPIEDDLLELLCLVYLLNVGPEPLSDQMISANDLRNSLFFKGPHELEMLPLLRRYGRDLDGFKEAAERLGSEIIEAADVSYRIPVFPKIPIYYLFWKGDEEFAPRLSILFDQSIEYHLSADAIWGLTNLVSEILLMGAQWSLV